MAPSGPTLVVPDEMSDTIAFAYVPTAPIFFASHVSPIVDVYHLEIGEVTAALRVGAAHRAGWTGRGDRTRQQLQRDEPNRFNELRDLENLINDAIADGITIVFAGGNGHRAFPAGLPA